MNFAVTTFAFAVLVTVIASVTVEGFAPLALAIQQSRRHSSVRPFALVAATATATDEEDGAILVATDVEVIVSDADDTKSVNRDQLQKEAFLKDAAQLIESFQDGLAKGGADADLPEEAVALQTAMDDPASSVALLSQRIYEFMIEKAMRYDLNPATGALTPTKFTDLQNMLGNVAVKNEFFRQYSFGMQAAMTGVLDVETVQDVVQERLISRTGLTPDAFDAWLGF